MHTLEIPNKNKTIEFPSCWEEMTQKQFLKIMELIINLENKEITIDDFNLQSTLILVGIVTTQSQRSKINQEMINDNIALLSEYFDFIFKIKKGKNGKKEAVLNFNSIHQFLPQIKSYTGPLPGLTDLNWNQLTKAMTFYKKYIQTKDTNQLDKLVATLYKKEGHCFDAEKIENISNELKDIPFSHKYYVFLFFRNCLSFIQNAQIDMNGEKISLAILFEYAKKKSKSDGLGLVGLQMSIAESGVFGDMDGVGTKNIYDIYAYLYKNKFAYLEWKREQKQNND